MTRARTAVVLAVLAVVAVVATVVVAVTRDEPDVVHPRSVTSTPQAVTDPRSGAQVEVPEVDWRVRGGQARIFYADAQGRPAVVARGLAVYRPGYCQAEPEGSYQAFVGFTRQPLDDWVDAIGTRVDGSASGEIERATVRATGSGPCAAETVEVAMRSSGDVRLVLVADAGALGDDQVDAVLGSLELAEPDVAD